MSKIFFPNVEFSTFFNWLKTEKVALDYFLRNTALALNAIFKIMNMVNKV